jgi:hypothetical protein
MHPFGRNPEPVSADIYQQKNVPVSCCEIFGEQAAALAVARGDIRLLLDASTGLISNAEFDSDTQQFSDKYNGSQHGSAHFGRYASDLSRRLAIKHALHGKHVVEIGCGDGTFLKGLCDMSGARGTGIDPSLSENGLTDGPVRFLSERVGLQHYGLKPDLIICRHTLEHILQLDEILRYVSGLMQGKADIPFYVDVPDARRIADEGAFWDVYYEHCHYFTPDSLQACLRKYGFQVEELHSEFDGQYLCATAYLRSASAPVVSSEESTALGARLSDNLVTQRKMWQDWIDAQSARSVVLWGSGSKAVAFLSSLRLKDQVAAVVDINPDKQNSFLAGSGHAVVSPPDLADLVAKRVIIMNPAYEAEIREVLSDLSISADILMLGVTQPQLNDMTSV